MSPNRAIGVAALLSSIVSGMVLHEQVGSLPQGWSMQSQPSAETPMILQVALPLQNTDELVCEHN